MVNQPYRDARGKAMVIHLWLWPACEKYGNELKIIYADALVQHQHHLIFDFLYLSIKNQTIFHATLTL
jgi:hypothetical protein